MPGESLAESLETILHTPLDAIRHDQSAAVVREVLRRDTSEIVVDVARFGSCI